MTADEIAQAANDIVIAIRSAKMDEPRSARIAREDRTMALRRTLAEEFGRRRGWVHNTRERCVQHLFGKRPSDYGRWERVPLHDHPSSYDMGRLPYGGRRTIALVSQPYGPLSESDIEAMHTWAAERGLVFEMPNWPSWHYPGWTTLCIFSRLDVTNNICSP